MVVCSVGGVSSNPVGVFFNALGVFFKLGLSVAHAQLEGRKWFSTSFTTSFTTLVYHVAGALTWDDAR